MTGRRRIGAIEVVSTTTGSPCSTFLPWADPTTPTIDLITATLFRNESGHRRSGAPGAKWTGSKIDGNATRQIDRGEVRGAERKNRYLGCRAAEEYCR